LLFLTSIELHIHTQEAASVADHGSSVSVSGFNTDGLMDEITVSPDGILKLPQVTFNLFLMMIGQNSYLMICGTLNAHFMVKDITGFQICMRQEICKLEDTQL